MIFDSGYVINKKLWEQENTRKRNYWWIYIEEILGRLGMSCKSIDIENLDNHLDSLRILFLGPDDYGKYHHALKNWVKNGGILFGFNSSSIDEIFGNKFEKKIFLQNPFSINGYLNFTGNSFLSSIKGKFPVASDVNLVTSINSKVLACFRNFPVITSRRFHNGYAFYFGFDIAKTFWVINQGRPVDMDYDGDGYLRNGDGIILKSIRLPVTDEFLFFLQNILCSCLMIPLIYHLPPLNDKDVVPDAVFFYGGDDESTRGIHFSACEFMKGLSLPYHINIMPDKNFEFAIDGEEFRKLEENNTEISLHYNFMDHFTHPAGFTEDDVGKQTKIFIEKFKKIPVCVNTHYLRWTGWYEPALWLEKYNIRGYNGKIHFRFPPVNPVNRIGFAFGTSFPFFYWTDYTYENKKIEFVDLPITFYECGYSGEKLDSGKIERAVDLAANYHTISNFFYHPVYIARFDSCRKAIRKIVEIADRKNLKILHSTPDRVTQWWIERSKSKISDIELKNNTMTFNVFCTAKQGIAVRIYTGNKKIIDANFPFKMKKLHSKKFLFLFIPHGENKVKIKFSL